MKEMDIGLISIIVPVYNVEEYVGKCIDSILSQTYTNFEAILIDDGSTDKSGEICDIYAQKDKRIKVFHKENTGVASVRNCGLAIACGKYISFVDSDDYVEKDFLECFAKGVMDTNADIVIMGHTYDKKDISIKKYITSETTVLCKSDAISELLLDKKIKSYLWQGMFNRKIFDEIKFPSGENYEDFRVLPYIFLRANYITLIPKEKYHYVQRMKSITNNTAEKIEKNSYSLFISYIDRVKLARKINLKRDVILQAEAKTIRSGVCYICNITKGLFKTKEEKYNLVEKYIIDNYSVGYKNNYLENEYKIKITLIFLLHSLIKIINCKRGCIEN